MGDLESDLKEDGEVAKSVAFSLLNRACLE